MKVIYDTQTIILKSGKKHAPWPDNAQVEQDLIIERALVEIFSDDLLRSHLAFRGGTAFHKLYLSPQARYSEDIDLVQIKKVGLDHYLTKYESVFLLLDKNRTLSKANITILLLINLNQKFLP